MAQSIVSRLNFVDSPRERFHKGESRQHIERGAVSGAYEATHRPQAVVKVLKEVLTTN